VGLLASLAFDAARNWRERLQLRLAFGGYASPMLMRQIESGEVSPDSDGARGHVCVLFADLRDFTRMSEQMPPEEVMRVLNVFLGEMTQVVHDHGGIVDKFIGDSLMAIFGQPVSVSRPEQAAMEAAHAMLLRLQQLNGDEFAAQKLQLVMGVGIHSGEAVLGYVGSRDRHDFTAIGDTVNIAARLESLSKSLGVPIVCSDVVARRAGMPSFLRDMGEQAIRGRAAMHVYGWNPLAEGAAVPGVQIHAAAPA
jgi:class 3 adenylate cyclase